MTKITEETREKILETKAELERRLEICNAVLEGMPMKYADQKYGGKVNSARDLIIPRGKALPRIHMDNPVQYEAVMRLVRTPAEKLYEVVFHKELNNPSIGPDESTIFGVFQYPDDLDEAVEYVLADEKITDRERRIYQLRFVEGKTLEEAARELCLTRERVRQIEAKFLRKLRAPRLSMILVCGLERGKTLEERIVAERRYQFAKERYETDLMCLKKYNEDALELERKHKEFEEKNGELAGFRSIRDEMDIAELNLSVRSYNVLKRANIQTVGDLKKKSISQLSRCRNMGKKSLSEIVNRLKEYDGTILPKEPKEDC